MSLITNRLEDRVTDQFMNFIKGIFKRQISSFVIILGRRETGKTDLALLIAEILFFLGLVRHVATNIKIYNSPFLIDHISNLDDLKFWAKTKKGRKVFLFDEMGKAMRRRTPMSSLNVKLIDQFQILRKYKMSTIAITVNEKYVDTGILGTDMLDGFFFKPNYKNPEVALYHDSLENWEKELYGIPRTSIKFDTWDVATFTEHSEVRRFFREKDKQILWEWCNGATAKALGVSRMKIRRLAHKYIKKNMETERNT